MGTDDFSSVLRKLRKALVGVSQYPTESHIVDMIYFGNSEESRAIQLVDVYCSTITRYLRGDIIALPYYELLRQQVVNDGTRPRYENADKTISVMRRRREKYNFTKPK